MNKDSKFIHVVVDDILSKEWKGLKSLSYTMWKALHCPVYYYFSYIQKQDISNYHIIKGIIVHQLYEEAFKHLNHRDRIDYFNLITKQDIERKVKEFLENSKSKVQIDNKTLQHLINDIYNSLNIYFISLINKKLKQGFNLYIEQPNRSKREIELFNTQTDLYTKSDIILTKEDTVEIIDIKTGKIYPEEHIKQVIFYLYSYLQYAKEKEKEIKNLIGSIYSTKQNKYQILLYTNRDYVIRKFNSMIQEIRDIYSKLNVNSIKELRDFVEHRLTNERNIEQYEFIKEKVNCKFCPYRNICPIYNQENQVQLINTLKNLPSSEKIVSIEIPEEKPSDISILNSK